LIPFSSALEAHQALDRVLAIEVPSYKLIVNL
jgi:hypothetical protein